MNSNWKSPIGKLRILGAMEGASFVGLMGIGMPLKYMMDAPMGVKILGPIHGFLYIWLLVELAQAVFGAGWAVRRGAVVFFAALIPFGPFLIDGWLKRCQGEFAEK